MHLFRLSFDHTCDPSIQRSRGEITISSSMTPAFGDLLDDPDAEDDGKMEPPMELGTKLHNALCALGYRDMVLEFFSNEGGVGFFVPHGDNPDVKEVQDNIRAILTDNLAHLAP